MNTELARTPERNSHLVLSAMDVSDRSPAAVYLANLQPTGRRTQRQALDTIARMLGARDAFRLDWSALRSQHTAAIRAKLAESYSPASANKILSALRRVLKEAWRLGLMTAEDYHRAADVDRVRGEATPRGRELTPGEILALMTACQLDPGPAGVRDAAILSVMYAAGLMRAEVAGLRLWSCQRDGEGFKLVLTEKPNKERAVYVNNGAANALADWLQVRGGQGAALFVAINKAGKLDTTKPMTDQAIYDLFRKRGAEAGVKEFSPHDLRRTFISDLLDKGADIAIVAKMAGHANVQTTARYDKRPEEAKRKAASLLQVPYSRRVS
jgi:site-specific recombinase XerD